ncbi:MAG: class I SAM-dependent methyltransferase [Candidatus Omnitrophica bacterium]|nr:class I SAM-dependent methyltransferase [Candidatus Omnitrophota bacterium]
MKSCPLCSMSHASYERTIDQIDLIKCGKCHFVYANLDEDQIRFANSACNETFASEQKEKQSFIDAVWFELIAKKIKKEVSHGKILDIGCGNGVLLKHFLGPQWEAHGLDFSPWAVEFAQLYGYKLINCELEKADFPNAYFDVITSTSTLEHIPNPLPHIRKIIELLAPGGLAYFSGIPNYGSLSVKLNMSSFYQNNPPKHVNYFTYHTLSQLFDHPEISKDIECLRIYSYGIPELHRAYHLVRNVFQKINLESSEHPTKPETSGALSEKERAQSPLMKRFIMLMLIVFYYGPGTLFHLGDKLQVIVKRK